MVARPVPPQALLGGAEAIRRLSRDLLVLHAPPQPFDKHVVPPTAGAVPPDLEVLVVQESRALPAGELAPWVRVEEGGRALASPGLVARLAADVGRQRVGPPPRPHAATRPLPPREARHEAPRQGTDPGCQ